MWNFLILSSPIDLKGLCAHDCKNHKDIRASACINSFVRSALHHRCTTHQTCNGIQFAFCCESESTYFMCCKIVHTRIPVSTREAPISPISIPQQIHCVFLVFLFSTFQTPCYFRKGPCFSLLHKDLLRFFWSNWRACYLTYFFLCCCGMLGGLSAHKSPHSDRILSGLYLIRPILWLCFVWALFAVKNAASVFTLHIMELLCAFPGVPHCQPNAS